MPSMLFQQPLMQAQRLLAWASGATSALSSSQNTPNTPSLSQQDAASQTLPTNSFPSATPLFGGSRPWNESGVVNWTSVDDRVRGGSSISHLVTIAQGSRLAARFYGTLDTKTLGGAGFASVTTVYDDNSTSFDLSSYDGVILRVEKSDDKRYTFILKDEVPGERADGRMMSGVSWEYDFYGRRSKSEAEEEGEIGAKGERDSLCKVSNGLWQVCIPWHKFKATYRGRELNDTKPLKTDQIKRFSLMNRSFFDKQDGDFEIVLDSIWAYSSLNPKKAGDDVDSKASL